MVQPSMAACGQPVGLSLPGHESHLLRNGWLRFPLSELEGMMSCRQMMYGQYCLEELEVRAFY